MTWAPWVLVVCAVAALLCAAYGAVRAALAARVVKQHADRLKALTLVADAAEAHAYVERINGSLAKIDGLLARANAAVASINASLQEMRIPEAVAAVRTAGAAIRLLFAGR